MSTSTGVGQVNHQVRSSWYGGKKKKKKKALEGLERKKDDGTRALAVIIHLKSNFLLQVWKSQPDASSGFLFLSLSLSPWHDDAIHSRQWRDHLLVLLLGAPSSVLIDILCVWISSSRYADQVAHDDDDDGESPRRVATLPPRFPEYKKDENVLPSRGPAATFKCADQFLWAKRMNDNLSDGVCWLQRRRTGNFIIYIAFQVSRH